MLWDEIFIRLGVAALLGGAIGLERQWHSHYVGLRTNTLITIGSAGLVIFALMLPTDDPTAAGRITAQIVTGIGFLCAGVLIHEGATVKGFHTAATLWCSVAVGMFAGTGQFMPAAVLAGFIVMVNLLLRPIVYAINRRTASAAKALDAEEEVKK